MHKRKPIPMFSTEVLARFHASYVEEGDCRIWQKQKTSGGYGRFRSEGTGYAAHRVALRIAKGPLGEDTVVDHLCRNRACVNPGHLEEVTQQENVERGLQGSLHPSRNGCARGHKVEGDNALSQGSRKPICRTCNRDYMREYMRTRSARAKASMNA